MQIKLTNQEIIDITQILSNFETYTTSKNGVQRRVLRGRDYTHPKRSTSYSGFFFRLVMLWSGSVNGTSIEELRRIKRDLGQNTSDKYVYADYCTQTINRALREANYPRRLKYSDGFVYWV